MRRRLPRCGTVGYANAIAPDGQTVAQAPQPMHRCGSTTTWSPSARIAAVEQTSMHWLQPVFCDRLWAQSDDL